MIDYRDDKIDNVEYVDDVDDRCDDNFKWGDQQRL